MLTIHSRVAEARVRLRQAGISTDEAGLDARLLAQFVLDWDAPRFYAEATDPEPPDFAARYAEVVTRRAGREPLAYITGRQEFWGLSFDVTPAVLIPRPETELIVESALELFPEPVRRLAIADPCTGSGCLAVTLTHERPAAYVVATDVSAVALEIARRNAGRHDVGTRVHCVADDLLSATAGPFDLIVSNPPYVPERCRPLLPPEVRNYEPPVALFAGDDGLAVVRRLVSQVVTRLVPDGVLIVECGVGQSGSVSRLISGTRGLKLLDVRHDLQGIPRTAIARRTAEPV